MSVSTKIKLHVEDAMRSYEESYADAIRFQERCKHRVLSTSCVFRPREWELFISYLLDRKGDGSNSGLDLVNTEVKSAVRGSGFDYHYYSGSWQRKLKQESQANHILISYDTNLRDFEVWAMQPPLITEVINGWQDIIAKSAGINKHARRQLKYKTVTSEGMLILGVKDSVPIFTIDEIGCFTVICGQNIFEVRFQGVVQFG